MLPPFLIVLVFIVFMEWIASVGFSAVAQKVYLCLSNQNLGQFQNAHI